MSTVNEEEKKAFDTIIKYCLRALDSAEGGTFIDTAEDKKLVEYVKEAIPDLAERTKAFVNKLPQLLLSDEKRMFEDTIDAFNNVIITICRGTVAEHVKAVSKYVHFHSLIEEHDLRDKYRTYLKENGGEHRICYQLPLVGTLRDEARKLYTCGDCEFCRGKERS